MSEVYAPTAIEAAAAALGAAGLAAYTLTLVGHAAPIADSYRDRVRDPKPGDLVVESSSFPMRDRKGYGHVAVGRLVSKGIEHIEEPPTELEPEGWAYDEMVFYVEPLTGGEVVRWTNAEFIAIPANDREARDWRQAGAGFVLR